MRYLGDEEDDETEGVGDASLQNKTKRRKKCVNTYVHIDTVHDIRIQSDWITTNTHTHTCILTVWTDTNRTLEKNNDLGVRNGTPINGFTPLLRPSLVTQLRGSL